MSRQQRIDWSILFGAGVAYAMALKYFVLPAEVVLTGTEGIAAAISYYTENSALFLALYFAFQAALLMFAFARVHRTFALRTAAVVGTVLVALALLPELELGDPESKNERLTLVIFGGLVAGMAKAMAFRHRGSTGDEDIVGAYVAMKTLRPVGQIGIAAAVFSTVFGLGMQYLKTGELESVLNTLMYTCVYIFASAETLNNMYHKFKITMCVIITKRAKLAGEVILELYPHRTYTVQSGLGGRSGAAFDMVRTIVTLEELPELLDALEDHLPESFYYHHDIEGVSSRYYIVPIGH